MVFQMDMFAGVLAALALGLSGCGTPVASGFPLNGIGGVSAEGVRNVTKTIKWENQEAKFEHTKSSEWKFYTSDYSCVTQPSGCSFSSRTEEKDSDVQSILLQSFESGALKGTRKSGKNCTIFTGPDSLSPALPKHNGTGKCLGQEDATCDIWRQYTAYKPKSNDQQWSKYKTEVLYYFNKDQNSLVAQQETQIVSSSKKTTTIVATVSFKKWELGDVGDDKFTADKSWNCDDKMAFSALSV